MITTKLSEDKTLVEVSISGYKDDEHRLTDSLISLARQITTDQLEQHKIDGLTYEGHEKSCLAKVIFGKKYAKVEVGDSGKYMVDLESGRIFGIKAYGQVNLKKSYGTLDTIHHYYWGFYCAEIRGIGI